MKYIFDSSFRYEPSFDTDVRRTFRRIRQELQAQARERAKPNLEGAINVLQPDHLKHGPYAGLSTA